jgi:hypothetical protein
MRLHKKHEDDTYIPKEQAFNKKNVEKLIFSGDPIKNTILEND